MTDEFGGEGGGKGGGAFHPKLVLELRGFRV
jgi:hypothetical protein